MAADSLERHEWNPPLPLRKPGLEDSLKAAGGINEGYKAAEVESKEDLAKHVLEVEKEAMRLRGMLEQAEIAWERGVKLKHKNNTSYALQQVEHDQKISKPSSAKGPLPEATANAKAMAQAAAARSNRKAQEGWSRRMEGGRQKAYLGSQEAMVERLAKLAEAALEKTAYAESVKAIKYEKRQPLGSWGNKPGDKAKPSNRPKSAPLTKGSSSTSYGDGGPPPGQGGGSSSFSSDIRNFLSSTSKKADEYEVLTHIRTVGGARGSRLGQFNHPAFVTCLPGGDLCVSDVANERVQLLVQPPLSGTCEVKRALGSRNLGGRMVGTSDRLRLGLACCCDHHTGVLYAIDAGDRAPPSDKHAREQQQANSGPRIRRINLTSTELLADRNSSGEAELIQPEGLALSPDGKTLCVSDSAKHHVLVFEAPGLKFLRTLGRKGSNKGQLRSPDGIAIHDGSLYVADVYNHRISVFHVDGGQSSIKDPMLRAALAPGGFERTIGRLGSDRGLFEFPRGVCIAHGWLLVSEPQRVQLLSLKGDPLQLLEVPGAAALRGICSDGWRAYVCDYEAHCIHVLKVDYAGAKAPPAEEAPKPSSVGWTQSKIVDNTVDQEKEATEKIKRFMSDKTVHFNGAGESNLQYVAQSWSLNHTDSTKAKANQDAIAGIAKILLDYPALKCEVHGETGAASSSPQPLADHFGLDAEEDVKDIMYSLARFRAQACMDELVKEGVPESQLFVTATSMGGHVGVFFVPQGATSAAQGASMTSGKPSSTSDFLAAMGGGASASTDQSAAFLSSGFAGGGGGGAQPTTSDFLSSTSPGGGVATGTEFMDAVFGGGGGTASDFAAYGNSTSVFEERQPETLGSSMRSVSFGSPIASDRPRGF